MQQYTSTLVMTITNILVEAKGMLFDNHNVMDTKIDELIALMSELSIKN